MNEETLNIVSASIGRYIGVQLDLFVKMLVFLHEKEIISVEEIEERFIIEPENDAKEVLEKLGPDDGTLNPERSYAEATLRLMAGLRIKLFGKEEEQLSDAKQETD